MAYPGYGAPGYGGMPPQADPLYGYFSAVAGQDQQIDATELQTCLTQSGIAGSYKQFNLDTCRIMIAMLNRDRDSRMGFQEFKELWGVLNQWKGTFMQYDRDRSGTIDPRELHAALTSWGYNLSPTALQIIVNRYSIQNRITFDDFVCCAVRLRSLTDHFRRRDTTQQGTATFSYDDVSNIVRGANSAPHSDLFR